MPGENSAHVVAIGLTPGGQFQVEYFREESRNLQRGEFCLRGKGGQAFQGGKPRIGVDELGDEEAWPLDSLHDDAASMTATPCVGLQMDSAEIRHLTARGAPRRLKV